ncbi:MAG TPA: hypothetical protein VM840_02900 [Actinomycetota bacterium]|nr:hypothetical protein [Actinomycetota bacterium]
MSRSLQLVLVALLVASGLTSSPASAQIANSVAIDDGGDDHLGWSEMNTRVMVYGSGRPAAETVSVRLAQPPGETPSAATDWVCVRPDTTQGMWRHVFLAAQLARFTDGPIEAQARFGAACEQIGAGTGSDTSIVDLVYPSTLEVAIAAADGVLLPDPVEEDAEPSAPTYTAHVSGRNDEPGWTLLRLDDEDPATAELRETVQTRPDGTWEASLDATRFADGRLRVLAFARDLAKNTQEPGLYSSYVLKLPSEDVEVARPRIVIEDGDGYLHADCCTVSPDDLSRVPISVTHVGPSPEATLSVTVSDGSRSVAGWAEVDSDGKPATPPDKLPAMTAARDQDVVFYADVRTLADARVVATVTAATETASASGTARSLLDRTPPRSQITTPTEGALIRCRYIWYPDILDGDGALFSNVECNNTFEGRSTDALGRATTVQLAFTSLDLGGTKYVTVRPNASTGVWSLNIHSTQNYLGPGEWELVARAQDDATNLEDRQPDGSNTVRFTIVPV